MCCMWDSYPFTNEPVGIPVKKKNNVLYMFGNFCSPENAAAYNFSMNDENVWERYSLLNEIYGDGKPINIANSKLLLKKYGGIYDIDEYRSMNIDKKYIINFSPQKKLREMYVHDTKNCIEYRRLGPTRTAPGNHTAAVLRQESRRKVLRTLPSPRLFLLLRSA